MRVLHTSDWHLGRTLYKQNRTSEYEAFLTWLGDVVIEKQVDALLVAGDIFDTTTPGNQSQEQYYRFLCRIALSPCRHVVVIAGNHDSPSFLNAPRTLLQSLNIHVVGSITETIDDEVLVLNDQNDMPEMIVGAVPYLRDRDIRSAERYESIDDKENKLIEGIHAHYAEVCQLAEQRRRELGDQIPLVMMGHLFTAGGQLTEADDVRELYVGTLAHIKASCFSREIDYLALGHLHVPQAVNKSEMMRYCGSPIAMSFKETKQQKSVCLVDFEGRTPTLTLVDVPVFQKLELIRGDCDTIFSEIKKCVDANTSIWVEVEYDGNEIVADLRGELEKLVAGTNVQILRITNHRMIDRILEPINESEMLEQLNELEVFQRCLALHEVPDNQQAALLQAYKEIVQSIFDEDRQD